jgi:hypothetical protein
MVGGDKTKDNHRTKLKSASARRENAVENPHIKQAQKKGPPSKSDVAPYIAGLEPQPHPESENTEPQPQPVGDVETDTTGAPGEPATVVEEMELEEAMLDGEVEDGGPNRRNVWQDPYEWLIVPDVFPAGPVRYEGIDKLFTPCGPLYI